MRLQLRTSASHLHQKEASNDVKKQREPARPGSALFSTMKISLLPLYFPSFLQTHNPTRE